METTDEQLETLRLLKAFMYIEDPGRRREIIALVENLADEYEKDEADS